MLWPKRQSNNIKPFLYIGSKTNCTFENGVMFDCKGKEYWTSCEQPRFKRAIEEEKPIVEILAITPFDIVINIERSEQLKVQARDNDDYFNLVYAGGGFGVFGHTHPAKRPEVRANMKASNYMNQPDYRPWKTSRANPNDWKLSDIAYNKYIIINSQGRTCGWRRLIGSGISVSETTAKSMIKQFNKGWIPNEDPEFIKLKCLT
ncbi:putative homing endonuclease [Escherichia phage vb_EcoM-VR5]|uniref:Putative homing endonuclease n=1 Tax=Escherichia phage vb_EcoM-VR5 TaxID=1567026 RepID=A0A0A7HFK5_9CAUD|nr:homing endonuclease [Escherichia phage vb_EcoM-VR5]AIZ02029.1 putative homing endonuclease [Escherichia phage vb_EcoM-VR5]